MVNILYAISAFVCAIVMLILPDRVKKNLNKEIPIDKAFLYLISWTAIFCLVDGTWGIAASDVIINDMFLYIMSVLFHTCAAFTPYVWICFVLAYIGSS